VSKEKKETKAVRSVLEVAVDADQLGRLLDAGKLLLKGNKDTPDIRIVVPDPEATDETIKDYEELADLAQEIAEDLQEDLDDAGEESDVEGDDETDAGEPDGDDEEELDDDDDEEEVTDGE